MATYFDRAVRIIPFVLLGTIAYTICVLAFVDSSSAPLAYSSEAYQFALLCVLTPGMASFEMRGPEEFLVGAILSTVFGIVVCVLMLTAEGNLSSFLSVGTIFMGMALFAWGPLCFVYFMFFVLGDSLRRLHLRLGGKKS